MNQSRKRKGWQAVDLSLAALGLLFGPALGRVARARPALPRFQMAGDRFGYQLRSTHYYEPTYALADLSGRTATQRHLSAIDLNESGQLDLLARMAFAEELLAIPVNSTSPEVFGYENQMFGYGDAEILYNVIRLVKPRRIVEIGSGKSTLMARLAIEANKREDSSYVCDHVCIEPYEAPWLESTGVRVIRERVETLSLDVFSSLKTDDILFIDSSHIIRPSGDVLVEYLEILPQLTSGVWVHVHDIFTPRGYPDKWDIVERRLWNEQYLLEAFLSFNTNFRIECAVNWLFHNHLDALSGACPMVGRNPGSEPGSFWIRRVG